MALSVVQHSANTSVANANTIAVTVSATGAGHLLVAAVAMGTAATSSASVSDGTNAFTLNSGADAVFSGAGFCQMWYLLSSSSGKTTITATASGAAGTYLKVIHVWEVSGWTTCATDGAAGVSDQSGVLTDDNGPTVTTTGSVGFGAALILPATGIASNPKAGNAFTAGGDIDAFGISGCSIITSSAGAIQPVWTDNASGSTFAASLVAFKDTGGGGGRTLFYRSGLDGLTSTGPKQLNPSLG